MKRVNYDEFDIFWYDMGIQPGILNKLKPYQRINQWPGIQIICHKNKLGQNLMKMYKEFPSQYNFFPVTYVLPYEMNKFKQEFLKTQESDDNNGNSQEKKTQVQLSDQKKSGSQQPTNTSNSATDKLYNFNLDQNGRERING